LKTYAFIFLIGLGLGAYLFFNNPWLQADYHSDSYSWFVDFSRSIFQSQSAYYAESILLPLIGKLIGAARSILLYKSLCAVITLGILPIAGVLAQRYFQNFYQALTFILLFGLSFQYLQFYILGFPDPLTIVLLLAAIFQRNVVTIFCLVTLALLSHFSMAAVGVLALLGLIYTSPIFMRAAAKKYYGSLLISLLTGKCILLSWYWIFHYQLQSRLNWALDKGYPFFFERYQADLYGFWLTPCIKRDPSILNHLIGGYFINMCPY
jgi:glucan phosphoethanolaminetransferase (alkaline phosphatase superfamily)